MDFFMGQIVPLGITYAPKGMALCQGQMMQVTQNQALFSLLGTTFGGDGKTTFGLPNITGRTMLGGTVLGVIAGEATHTLTSGEIPPHSHALNAVTGSVGNTSASGAMPATSDSAVYTAAGNMVGLLAAPLSQGGGNLPHNNMQPSMAINIGIVLAGIFPTRG